jgi:hypothetical protein
MKVFQPSVAAVRLITLSGLMLFVELALIRWTGSNLVYLSYFSNFVLLGSFLGIGVGFLRAKSTGDIFQWASVVLALLVGFTLIFPVQIECGGSEIIFFGCSPSGLPIWLTLPVVFLAVAAVMASIAQGVGRAFVGFDPLDAYRLDIVGSLVGIVAFTILSFLGAPPLAWGCIVVAVLAFFYLPDIRLVQIVSFGAILFLLGKESFEPHLSWSPYYKIELTPQSNGMQSLSVNGIPHQMIESIAQRKRSEPIYLFPYKRIVHNPLDNVLIVGAGNGVDVALALAAGAKHVDAVEIDPRILQIGHRFNPNHPYQDPRVTAYNDDGRAFLQKSHSSYDLILFALPDSLSLVSGQSSLRLESYLFTIESMRAARALLKPDGAYGMYNYYRQTWLIDRLAHTLELAYGHRPCVDSTKGNVGRFSLLIVGREAANVRCAATWAPTVRDVPVPADDDHPFLYLRTPSIPQLYLIAIASILLASLIVIRVATGPLAQMRGYLDLFFMGAAFMLLETKNVVQFALLFGTTWFVNALVFFGVLVSVLLSIEVTRRTRLRQSWILYVGLFGSLSVAWLIRPEMLLALNAPTRFCAATLLAFAPIFFANLVFAERFRGSSASSIAFGANLLGAMLGGVIEYASLVVGYRALLPIIAALYAIAFIIRALHRDPVEAALEPSVGSPLAYTSPREPALVKMITEY